MQHVYWVLDHVLAGRPGPRCEPWDPAALYAGGIRVVISLAAEETTGDLTSFGLRHYQAEFPPVLLFSKGMRKAFIYQALPVWAYIDEQVRAGTPTLVHCYHGKDRTGAILAGYLMTYQGLTRQAAWRRLRKANPAAMTAAGFAEVLDLLTPNVLPDPRTLL
jgi:protein tyrosine/serine phosphatase